MTREPGRKTGAGVERRHREVKAVGQPLQPLAGPEGDVGRRIHVLVLEPRRRTFERSATRRRLRQPVDVRRHPDDDHVNMVQLLGCLRDRDDADLVVRGESQGGMQSIAMAGLNPHVTELIASVPAGSDTLAKNIGRLPGWPYWHNQGKTDADKKAIMQTSRYYDPLNFAHLVTCPAMISVALRDTTAVAPGVIAMTNSLGGPHELVLMVNGTHTTDHQESVRRVSEWYASLLKTNQPPPLH